MGFPLFTVLSAFVAVATALSSTGPSFTTTRTPAETFSPKLADIRATAATALSLSPTSNVQGKAFNRIIQIWLENTNFNAAAGIENMQWLAKQGILLTNYWAVTHPSQPNYAAAVAGEYFGLDSGDFVRVPSNISTVADLLDTRGISWGEYQENAPHAGFQGFNFSDQQNFRNNYMRKHNPLIIFESVVGNATRLSLIKNETAFHADVKAETLPQWSFYTPNMLNDGHDTNVAYAADATRKLVEPFLANEYFMKDTLVVVSFDESEVYGIPNRVFTVLLGGAINRTLHGTTDATFYTHYSTLATVEQNWDLPSLGRWDCDANVFALVANATGYRNAVVDTTKMFLNVSYPGPLNNGKCTPGWWPVPNTIAKCASGRGVLRKVVETWGEGQTGTYDYTNVFPLDDFSGVGVGPPTVAGVNDEALKPTARGTPMKPNTAGTRIQMGGLAWTVAFAGLITMLCLG